MVLVLVLLTFIGVILFCYIRQSLRERAQKVSPAGETNDIAAHAIPSGYGLCCNHLWIQELPSGARRIGVDELLQRFIGVPDRIDLMSPGHIVTRGESLAVIQRDGKELHIKSPFDAQVSRTNMQLVATPNVVSSNPYRVGWLYQLARLDPGRDRDTSRKGYDAVKWLTDESLRLTDFLQKHLTRPEPVGITLADGGTLRTGLMDYLNQEQIIEFEETFLADDRTQ